MHLPEGLSWAHGLPIFCTCKSEFMLLSVLCFPRDHWYCGVYNATLSAAGSECQREDGPEGVLFCLLRFLSYHPLHILFFILLPSSLLWLDSHRYLSLVAGNYEVASLSPPEAFCFCAQSHACLMIAAGTKMHVGRDTSFEGTRRMLCSSATCEVCAAPMQSGEGRNGAQQSLELQA